jgi:hypothetical protein
MNHQSSHENLSRVILYRRYPQSDFHNEASMNTSVMEKTISSRQQSWRNYLSLQLLFTAVLGLILCASPGAFAEESQQKTFETPEAAAAALIEALGSETTDEIFTILDPKFKDELIGGDEAAAKAQMKRVHSAAKEMYRVRPDVDDRMLMLVGKEVWPIPFPIIKDKERWRFDTEAGLEEVINRRVGRNELNAISVARAYIAAQDQYASVDRDGDEVLEYAQRLGSRPDRKDGLYWESAEDSNEELSPFGPLVSDARDYLMGRDPGDPFMGYYFKVLTSQGLNPPGGRYDYIINGNMIAGFGLIAFPADYDNSGLATFVVNQQGVVYEKDLGEDTDLIAGGIDEYNPDETWNKVKN